MSVSVKGTYEPAGNLGGYLRSMDRDYRVTANDVVVSSAENAMHSLSSIGAVL